METYVAFFVYQPPMSLKTTLISFQLLVISVGDSFLFFLTLFAVSNRKATDFCVDFIVYHFAESVYQITFLLESLVYCVQNHIMYKKKSNPQTKNYSQLKNAVSRRNSLPKDQSLTGYLLPKWSVLKSQLYKYSRPPWNSP